MTDYHRESNVETTTFEDGTRVTADFANKELHVNGKRIERPEDD
jgi:phage baseplate assembly protein gpV